VAGKANAPPVPINKGVKLGIYPKVETSVEDLNLLPSADTKLKFCNMGIRD
jgi:hypothetical protein